MARVRRGSGTSPPEVEDVARVAAIKTKKKRPKKPNAPSSTAEVRPNVPVDLTRALRKHVALHPSPSRFDEFAAELGLTDVANQLVVHGAKAAGVDPVQLQRLRGQTVQVMRHTPLGFTDEIGDVVWPPNQSEGRGLGLEMTRTLLLRVGTNAVIKVKGAGQAHDHPGQQTQRVNDQRRPPIPNPILWRRAFDRTGTTHFGLQDTFAKDEFAHLLVMHALSKRVRGRFASAPIPIDAVRLTHVEMEGQPVSIVRARADRSLWRGHEKYFQRDIQDMFERLRTLSREPGNEKLINGAADGREFFDGLKAHPKKRQVALLKKVGFEGIDEMDVATRRLNYARVVLAERFTEKHQLGQVTLLESGQFRNNIGRVWRDNGLTDDPGQLRDQVYEQFFQSWGLSYEPGMDLAPYERAIRSNLKKTVKELGQMYGMLRAFGSQMRDSFHPKDTIGAEVTDFLDFEMPLPLPRPKKEEEKFLPLDEWPMYNGGLDLTVSALVGLFELPRETARDFNEMWRNEAVKIGRKTIALGDAGELDDLFGDYQPDWTSWIADEREEAQHSNSGMLASLSS